MFIVYDFMLKNSAHLTGTIHAVWDFGGLPRRFGTVVSAAAAVWDFGGLPRRFGTVVSAAAAVWDFGGLPRRFGTVVSAAAAVWDFGGLPRRFGTVVSAAAAVWDFGGLPRRFGVDFSASFLFTICLSSSNSCANSFTIANMLIVSVLIQHVQLVLYFSFAVISNKLSI